MLVATEAKKESLENLSKIKSYTLPEDFLFQFFQERILDQVEKGQLELKHTTFPIDRYSPQTFKSVTEKLISLGYKVEMVKNEAYQKMEFTIYWK